MKQLLPIYYLFTLVFITQCTPNKTPQNKIYFGGEIVNPSSKYVLLFKDKKLIDSIALDTNNRFIYQFKNFQSGLYTFSHNEYQYLYLEPNDSLFLRVNTIDFDETLTFSGKGADKNNLLIRSFLMNEKDVKETHQLFNLSPKEFNQKTNDDLDRRRIALDRYTTKYEFSEKFKAIVNTHIAYHIYALKERYAMVNKKKEGFSLPKNYYSFRENIDLNAEELVHFYPYSNYLNTFISNITYHKNSCKNHLSTYTAKLKVIDSLITNTTIKNSLFHKIGYSYFNKKDNTLNRNTFITTLSNHTNDKELTKQLTTLSNQLSKLSVGTPIPNFEIINLQNDSAAIQNLITTPTVLYFWSQKYPRHLKSVHKKVAQYQQKSNYKFIGICIDNTTSNWKTIATKFKLSNDYIIANSTDVTKKLMLYSIHKTFAIDKNGTILSSDLNLFDVQFEEKLKKL